MTRDERISGIDEAGERGLTDCLALEYMHLVFAVSVNCAFNRTHRLRPTFLRSAHFLVNS